MTKKGGGGGGILGSWSKDRPPGATLAIKDTGQGILDNWLWLQTALAVGMSFPGDATSRGWPIIPGRYTEAGRDLIASPSDGMWIARGDVRRIEYYDEATGKWIDLECAALGELRMVAFDPSSPPEGWLECNGAAVSRTTYAALFAVVGTAYGAGDGSTTFNLPNMKGRVSVGLDRSGSPDADFDAIGDSGGEKEVTLVASELPTHDHNCASGGNHQHNLPESGSGAVQDEFYYHASAITDTAETDYDAGTFHDHTVDDSGETRDNAHENRMKYLVVGAIIYAGT